MSSHVKKRSSAEKSKYKTMKKIRKDAKLFLSHGQWKPMDDLALIIGVEQTNDLSIVHQSTKFSCHFTLDEVKQRWNLLMYDETISGLAIACMRTLHHELIEKVEKNALFSPKEEEILTQITNLYPQIEDFEKLLNEHKHQFFPTRTAKDLFEHFVLMKNYNLLPSQVVTPLTTKENVSFFDAELHMKEQPDHDFENPQVLRELETANRQNIREIRHLEEELKRWSILVQIACREMPEMDNQTFAVLRGRTVRFMMKSIQVSLGRNTKENRVDIDLALEGNVEKISRKQGSLKLRMTGDFFLANEGKRPIFVNGMPIMREASCRLWNNSVVEIADLSFIFVINRELVDAFRRENELIEFEN